jgi:2-hydroxy-6-oxonona-2,4-dienedioate hydrolase
MATRRAVVLGGLALAALAAGAWRFRSDLAAAGAGADPAHSRLVATRFGALELADAGEGPPVLMLHGTGGGFDQALAMGGPLLGHGFRLIGPSRFGYLRTPMPADASPAAEADAMADLLDALGLDRVAVVGGSAGAIPALAFALGHPDRCAALVALVPALPAPGLPPPEPWSPMQEWLANRVLGSTCCSGRRCGWCPT